MKIFVGCSSSNDLDEKYYFMTKRLGDYLVDKYDLILGGVNSGMMNILYNIYQKNNCNVEAVIAKKYEIYAQDKKCSKTIVEHACDRMIKLVETADIILILPGGIGTYSEIFGSIEEKRTTNYKTKIIIYNYMNYYNNLKNILSNIYQNNFNEKELQELYTFIDDEEELYELLK